MSGFGNLSLQILKTFLVSLCNFFESFWLIYLHCIFIVLMYFFFLLYIDKIDWVFWCNLCALRLNCFDGDIDEHGVFSSRRKKKCIRYMESGDSNDGNQSDDNLGSCGSVGDAHTPPDDDTESLNQSLSSPGGLSGLSSLTSPSMILPSPSTSLASPSVSLASPCMSLQSPLTPHDSSTFDSKMPPVLQPHRNPVGTNPHDINNPLSVNQLTGQCVKNTTSSNEPPSSKDTSRPVISVT